MDLKPEFRLIIAGSRSFNDMELLRQRCDFFLEEKKKTHDIVIISGTARGADQAGEAYAKERGFKVRYFSANWSGFGKGAGIIRNMQMLDNADATIVFWDGISSGSRHMMTITRDEGKPLRVVRF